MFDHHALESLTYGDKVYTPNAEGVIDLSEVTFDANTPMQFHVKGVGATIEKGTLNADTQEMTLEVRGEMTSLPTPKAKPLIHSASRPTCSCTRTHVAHHQRHAFRSTRSWQNGLHPARRPGPGIVFKGTTNEGYTVSESVFDNKAKTHTVNVVDRGEE